MNTDLFIFLQAWTGGADVSDAERQRLLRLLETNTDFRAECAEEIWLLGMIRAVQTPPPRWLRIADALGLNAETMADSGTSDLATKILDQVRQREPEFQSSRSRSRWLLWRPLAAAAAGIVFVIFCTSVVFAYVAPAPGKVVTLLDDSFESGPAPLVTGVPMEPGTWSGDYSEVVAEQQGVKPERGKSMLRFLRGDYDGKPNPEESHSSEVYRLIDLRPYRREFADGGAVVQLSAVFNALTFPADERFDGSLTLYALDVETATNGSTRNGIKPEEMPLGLQKRRMSLDRNLTTWQRLMTDLRLPPDTDFLLIRISIQYAPKSPSKATFAGHYVDHVRLTMARRKPLP